MTGRLPRGVCVALATVGTMVAGAASAQSPQDARMPGWSNNTELSWVVATGNAKANAVGFRNVYAYRWMRAELSWESGWVRAASRDGGRFAVVTAPGEFAVVEPAVRIDSQRLHSKVRYQRQIAGRHDWFSNVDVVRDEPSNIARQVVLASGLGTTWHDSAVLTIRTSYGVSYTDEDLTVEGIRRFGGYRLFYGVKARPADGTAVESELTADGSFDEAADLRADWLNSVSVAINSNIALKSSVRVLFRNRPALQTLPLQMPAGVAIGTVEVPKEHVDTSITTSLAISF
jgi:putative salt-induced outer membrane protein YdiY